MDYFTYHTHFLKCHCIWTAQTCVMTSFLCRCDNTQLSLNPFRHIHTTDEGAASPYRTREDFSSSFIQGNVAEWKCMSSFIRQSVGRGIYSLSFLIFKLMALYIIPFKWLHTTQAIAQTNLRLNILLVVCERFY